MVCECTTKHVPKPMNFVMRAGVHLCPTSACNLDALLLEWSRHHGEPPGWVTKHYSQFIRELAKNVMEDTNG